MEKTYLHTREAAVDSPGEPHEVEATAEEATNSTSPPSKRQKVADAGPTQPLQAAGTASSVSAFQAMPPTGVPAAAAIDLPTQSSSLGPIAAARSPMTTGQGSLHDGSIPAAAAQDVPSAERLIVPPPAAPIQQPTGPPAQQPTGPLTQQPTQQLPGPPACPGASHPRSQAAAPALLSPCEAPGAGSLQAAARLACADKAAAEPAVAGNAHLALSAPPGAAAAADGGEPVQPPSSAPPAGTDTAEPPVKQQQAIAPPLLHAPADALEVAAAAVPATALPSQYYTPVDLAVCMRMFTAGMVVVLPCFAKPGVLSGESFTLEVVRLLGVGGYGTAWLVKLQQHQPQQQQQPAGQSAVGSTSLGRRKGVSVPKELVLKVAIPPAAIGEEGKGSWVDQCRQIWLKEYKVMSMCANSVYVLDCFGWGEVEISCGKKLPVLLLEYAQHGSVQDALVGPSGQPQALLASLRPFHWSAHGKWWWRSYRAWSMLPSHRPVCFIGTSSQETSCYATLQRTFSPGQHGQLPRWQTGGPPRWW